MSDQIDALVKFEAGWERDGTSADGLPYYRGNIIVHMDKPPNLGVHRIANEQDFNDHPLPFQLFQKESEARKATYAEGYPLCMWPAVNEAEFKMLVDRDITTVEQLAGLAKRGAAPGLPPEIKELSLRAAKLIELQKGAPKFEELLKERDGRIEVLEEQVKDAAQTIAGLKTLVDQLRLRGAN
jgi:hypothetical protein